MFSEQVHLLDDLEGQVDANLLMTLRTLLGNCQQVLNHRGEINLGWSPGELEGGHANPVMNIGGGYSVVFAEGSNLVLAPGVAIKGVMQWAVVQAGNANADAAVSVAFSVKTADPLTGIGVGAAFNVNTPIKTDVYTALFEDDIVSYDTLADGQHVVTSKWAGAPFGATMQWVRPIAAIPKGWRLLDGDGTYDARGRVLMGYNAGSSGDDDTIGEHGGSVSHTHTAHADHAAHTHTQADSTIAVANHASHTHTVPDHSHLQVGESGVADDNGDGTTVSVTVAGDATDAETGVVSGDEDATQTHTVTQDTGKVTSEHAAQSHTDNHSTVLNKQLHLTVAFIERFE